jgi:hypothetical protein
MSSYEAQPIPAIDAPLEIETVGDEVRDVLATEAEFRSADDGAAEA